MVIPLFDIGAKNTKAKMNTTTIQVRELITRVFHTGCREANPSKGFNK
jgi:hypothetical protein